MATRLVDDVWWFDLQGVNAYLIRDGDALTLVDAGMRWHSSRLAREIRRVADDVSDVDRVLVTHFDFDHIGALASLDDLEAPVYVGVEDEPYLAGRAKPDWTLGKGTFQRVTDVMRDPPSQPVETVEDGDTIGGFTAYHTPGHTPGHTVFVHESLSAAFLGDMVRERDGDFERPPWFLNYDHSQARESIAGFVERAPEFVIAAPGHGRPVTREASAVLARCADDLATMDAQ
jgi:glyoxylase-like metal-dependent hydrolase (beta-lactamase superfamily II)